MVGDSTSGAGQPTAGPESIVQCRITWHPAPTAQHTAPTARHARPTNRTSSTPRTLHPPRYSTLAARHLLPSTGLLAASRPKKTNAPLLSAATVPRRCPRPAPITAYKGMGTTKSVPRYQRALITTRQERHPRSDGQAGGGIDRRRGGSGQPAW